MVSVDCSQDPLEASTKRGVMHLLCCNLRFCHASHFTFNQSQSDRFSPRQIEVVRALDYHLKFKEANGSADAAISQAKNFLLTNVTAISTRWRAFPADFSEISIWLLVARVRRVAIPPNDAIVAESSIIHTHFGTTAGNKGEARRRQWWKGRKRSGSGRGVSSSGVAAPRGTSYLQKAILNLCKFLSRASQYTT